MKLPFHDPMVQALPDAMHTIKDAVVNTYSLLVGKDDTIKCRKCELNNGKRFGITPAILEMKINRKQPNVPYTLSFEEIEAANRRAANIITPKHVDFILGAVFSKASNLKSHDWKQVHYSYLLVILYVYMCIQPCSYKCVMKTSICACVYMYAHVCKYMCMWVFLYIFCMHKYIHIYSYIVIFEYHIVQNSGRVKLW